MNVRVMRATGAILVLCCALFVEGCSGVSSYKSTQPAGNSVPGVALQGIAHGGQQPIVGAHVYLYAASTSGYGGASTSLLASGAGRTNDGHGNYYVTTDAQGAFSITGAYSCPSAGSQVYLYSIGGNPGAGANSAAGLIAALGTCGSLTSSTYVVINEVSTIASAFAISGFATDATHVSNSGTTLANQGMLSAFATTKNLELLSSGMALTTTPAGNGIPPQQEINTLADVLAACVNSTGPSSAQCTSLFGDATNGVTTPTETATAAINIAHNPGANVTALYGLQSGSGPFQPTLSIEPNDFSVAITFSGGGLDGTGNAPNGIAIDNIGNVWVPNFTSSSVSEFSPTGAVLSGSTGFSAIHGTPIPLQPTSIAIDIFGNAWVAYFYGNSVGEFNANGAEISGPPGFQGSGLYQPYGIAIDNNSHTWIANQGNNNLSEFSALGAPLSGVGGFASGSLIGPAGIASDTSGNIWATNLGAPVSSITESNSSGGQYGGAGGFTGGGLASPYGIAIDGTGNVWVTNQAAGGSLSEFDSSGNAISGNSGFTGGGIIDPYGLAVDGAGNIWTANFGGDSLSEFSPSGTGLSGVNGYMGTDGTVTPVLKSPYGIAVDPSGNIWVANQSNSSSALTEFVGLATPVVTPIAAGVKYQQLGAKP